jgi:chemotaxis protein CheX
MSVIAEYQMETFGADIDAIVGIVFGTMVGVSVESAELACKASPDHLTASVFFGGDWQGAVLVECGRQTARGIAERLMGVPAGEQSGDDVLDAMGELANMVGGNLKSVLPRGIGLSMPSVVEGSDYAVRLCGVNPAKRHSFMSELGPLWVTVVEVDPRRRG